MPKLRQRRPFSLDRFRQALERTGWIKVSTSSPGILHYEKDAPDPDMAARSLFDILAPEVDFRKDE